MAFRLFLVLFSFLTVFEVTAQVNTDTDHLFMQALNSSCADPAHGIKSGRYLLKNAHDESRMAKGYYLISESSYLKDNYIVSIENLFKANEYAVKTNDFFLRTLILTSISSRCRMLGIYDRSEIYIAQAELLIADIKEKKKRQIAKARMLYERAFVLIEEKKYRDAQEMLSGSYEAAKDVESYPVLLAKIKRGQALLYFLASDNITAQKYYLQCISILQKYDLESSSVAAGVHNGLGDIALNNGRYEEAEKYFNTALSSSVIESKIKLDIYENLAKVYFNLNRKAEYQKYYLEHKNFTTAVVNAERQARNSLITQIEKEQNILLQKDKVWYTYLFLGIIIVFGLSFIMYYLYNKKLDNDYKRFEAILLKVNSRKDESFVQDETIEEKTAKGIIISEKTEQAVLERLETFEKGSEFTNPNLTVQLLAKKMKTNTKYLSEIIHMHKGVNFNAYINNLRINYIIGLMQQEKKYLTYKVSYLAEEAGFSSHSAFTVIFKSITNLTPKQFITFLKKKNEEKKEGN